MAQASLEAAISGICLGVTILSLAPAAVPAAICGGIAAGYTAFRWR